LGAGVLETSAQGACAMEKTNGGNRKPAAAPGEKNMFDLDGRRAPKNAPDRPILARTFTPEEQAEKLTGYIEIAKKNWPRIGYHSHVRYYTNPGGTGEVKFNSGGFVAKNPYSVKPNGEAAEKEFIKLQNGFYPKAQGFAEWIVAYEDIVALYVRCDAAALELFETMRASVAGLNDNIKKLAAYTEGLSKRLEKLEGKKA
jgi:hypothetical protein